MMIMMGAVIVMIKMAVKMEMMKRRMNPIYPALDLIVALYDYSLQDIGQIDLLTSIMKFRERRMKKDKGGEAVMKQL